MPNPPSTHNTGEQALRDLRSLWLVPTLLLSVIAIFFAGESLRPRLGCPFWVWWVLAIALTVPVYVLVHRRANALSETLHAGNADIAASRDQLAALNAIGRALAAELDLNRTLETICAELASALGVRRAAISLREPPAAERVHAAFGFDALPDIGRLYEGGSPAGEAGGLLKAGITGRDGAALGTLYAMDKIAGRFEEADADMLAAIATQAAIAIANARLYGESRRRGEDLRSLARRVSEAVASGNDLGRIATLVASQALKLIACDGAGVLLLDEGRVTLRPAGHGLAPTLTREQSTPPAEFYTRPLPLAASALLKTMLTAAGPLHFADAAKLGETGAWATDAGMRALVAAPLRGQGQGTIGLLLLHWSAGPRRVDEDELDLVAALAGFAAVAVENARLAAESLATQKELSERNARLLDETRRRGEELQTLVRRVGDALAAGLSSARVAELVAQQTRQMIPCGRVVFSVRENDTDFTALAVATEAGVESGAETPGWSSTDFPFLRDVLQRPNPVVIADVAPDERLTARERIALRRDDIASMLLAPLRGRGDRVVGLLSLFWTTTPYTPTPEEFKVADVLATQAAAALENVRLYQDLEQAQSELKVQLAETKTARDFVDRILQNVPAAVLVLGTHPQRPITRANTLAERMPDEVHRRDGLRGRRLADVFPGLEAVLEAALDQALQGESSTLTDVEYSGFERGVTYWTFSVTPQRDPATGQVAQIIVLALETTARINLLRENERQARREQQRANELDATLRSLGDGVVLCDASGRLISINRAGQVILEQGGEVLGERVDAWASQIGLSYPSGQPVPPGAVPLSRTLRTHQATEREEYLIYTGSGRQRFIELTTTPVLSVGTPSANLGGAVAVLRDITLLKQSQMQEAAANNRVATLVEISRRLNATLELDQISTIVTEGALALLPLVSDARALLYGLEHDELVLHSVTPQGRARRPRTWREAAPPAFPFDATSPLIWELYVKRQLVRSDDISVDSRFAAEDVRALLRGPVTAAPAGDAIRSVLILPLLARDVVSGHLVLTSSAPDAFDDPRLADALTNLAALAVIARVNAHLYQQMKQRAEELDTLWTVGQAIASKLELNEVVDTLTDRVRTALGGDICTLSLYSDDRTGGRSLRLQGTLYRDALLPVAQDKGVEPCDRVSAEAASKGEVVRLVGVANPALGECRWRAFAGQSGTHSVIAVPLNYGAETLGALTVYRRSDGPFTPEQEKLLRTLASLAVAAVRNAQTFEYEHNIAQTLQKSFLPEQPTRMPGLDIAEKYYPTLVDEANIGGDYYDFVRLGPRRLGVIIGDISGKGLAAAVHTAMAKYTLRAFAAQEMTPQEVVSRANVTIARYTTGEIFSTLFYGVIDLDAGTLTYVNAGHEPPQLRRAKDVVALEPTGPMMGAFADAEYEECCVPLRAGDVLALYTDGLSDARAETGEFLGEDGVRAQLSAHAGRASEGIADALYEAAVTFAAPLRLRDDIALLVLKVAPG